MRQKAAHTGACYSYTAARSFYRWVTRDDKEIEVEFHAFTVFSRQLCQHHTHLVPDAVMTLTWWRSMIKSVLGAALYSSISTYHSAVPNVASIHAFNRSRTALNCEHPSASTRASCTRIGSSKAWWR